MLFFGISRNQIQNKQRRKIMNNFDLELKTIQLQNEKLLRELEEVQKKLEAVQPQTENVKEFYTLEECWQLKGGCSLNTLKTNAFLRVGCGNSRYSRFIGGRLCFPKEEVFRWLKITDGPEYLEYAKSCGITVIPEKYLRLAQKAKQSVGAKTC